MANSSGFTMGRMIVIPPEKGSFPLDHAGVCRAVMHDWAMCMRRETWHNERCRPEAAAYLLCRIQNNLMAPEEVCRLGFSQEDWTRAQELAAATSPKSNKAS